MTDSFDINSIGKEDMFICGDCLDYMKQMPDKCIELAIVDPPYGGGAEQDVNTVFNGAIQGRFGGRFEKYLIPEISAERTGGDGGGWKKSTYGKDIENWDIAPTEEYFEELFRIAKNCVIWGGNYFLLPPTRCFLVWKKLTISENFTMAMAEYAWTSFNDNAKIFEYAPQGKKNDPRFHPTQKPIALYEWVLQKYAKQGDTILDTHVGSASSLIACHNTNHRFVGFEVSERYYRLAKERYKRETSQMLLTDYLEG